MALKKAFARKWIEIVKTNHMFELKRNLLLDQHIIAQWFPYMKDHSYLKGHSLLYCAIYFNQYTMVDFLLTNYPACYREYESPLYIRICCEQPQYDRLFDKFDKFEMLDMFALLLIKQQIPLNIVLNIQV